MKVMISSDDRDFKDKKFFKKAIDSFEYEIDEILFMAGKNDAGNDDLQKMAKQWAIDNNVTATPFKIDWNNVHVPGAVVVQGKFGAYNKNALFHTKDQMLEYCDGFISIGDTFDLKKAEKLDKYVHLFKIEDHKDKEDYEYYFWG